MIDYKKQGKRNLQNGRTFERKVREHLEKDGWIVSKWMNNLEYTKENSEDLNDLKLIQARQGKFRKTSTGFPDFIAFRKEKFQDISGFECEEYILLGVECKSNGYLSKTEKEKCTFYLKKGIFQKILIAFKNKSKKIEFKEFQVKD